MRRNSAATRARGAPTKTWASAKEEAASQARDLPHRPDALELSDVEAVEADELARLLGLDVTPRCGRPGLLELLPRALREQSRVLGTMGLEQTESIVARSQAEPSECTVDRAFRDPRSSQRELVRELPRTPGRPGQGQGEDLALDRGIELGRSPGATPTARGVKPVRPVAHEAPSQLVVEGAGNATLAAGGAHVSKLLSAPEQMQPEGVYLVLEGHRTFSFDLVVQQERRRKAPLALLRSSEVSRPLRRRSR